MKSSSRHKGRIERAVDVQAKAGGGGRLSTKYINHMESELYVKRGDLCSLIPCIQFRPGAPS